MKLRINKSLPGHVVGDEIEVETKGGVIKDRYWRNRLADAKIDKCVSIVDNEKTKQVEAT